MTEKPLGRAGASGSRTKTTSVTFESISQPPKNRNNKLTSTLAERVADYLLSRALVAAYRGRSHRLFIALARIAARLAEKGGTI